MIALMLAIAVLLALFLAFYVLWLFFLAGCNLAETEAAGRLTPSARRLAAPIRLFGAWLDYFVQYTTACIVFAEFPREHTVSERVARLISTGSGWRKRVAEWFRDSILKPFDRSGGHD